MNHAQHAEMGKEILANMKRHEEERRIRAREQEKWQQTTQEDQTLKTLRDQLRSIQLKLGKTSNYSKLRKLQLTERLLLRRIESMHEL